MAVAPTGVAPTGHGMLCSWPSSEFGLVSVLSVSCLEVGGGTPLSPQIHTLVDTQKVGGQSQLLINKHLLTITIFSK